jgi:hypothetical protein
VGVRIHILDGITHRVGLPFFHDDRIVVKIKIIGEERGHTA